MICTGEHDQSYTVTTSVLVYDSQHFSQCILAELQMLYHTYPILVFAIDVSSFLNKALHCVSKAFLSCNMQGSLLIEKKKKDVVVYVNWCYLSLFTLALEWLHTGSWNGAQEWFCLCLH